MDITILKWLAMLVCLMQSATFSGLNLGFFGVSRLRLEVLSEAGDPGARRILSLRKDSHMLLSTILWGNVACNVLIALITDSMLTGFMAFAFSTVVITLFGEIFPQAALARHAFKASVVLVPFIKFYQILLFPIAKPTAIFLDKVLGREQTLYFNEKEFKIMLMHHAQMPLTDVERLESIGALNFLSLDDIHVVDEGEKVNPKSIITLPVSDLGAPQFPEYTKNPSDPFLQSVYASHEKWVVIVDPKEQPVFVLDADQFLRDVVYGSDLKNVLFYCHKPIIVTDPKAKMGDVIINFKVKAEHMEDDVIDKDIILFWGKDKRIITGADILGRLLRDIVKMDHT